MALSSQLAAFQNSKSLAVFTICTACLTDGVTYGLVTPVVPFLLKDEGLVTEKNSSSSDHYTLLIASFSIADFFGALDCAWYVDRARSCRVPWYLDIVLITAGSFLFGFSNNIAMLICSRIYPWMGTAMSCNNIGMIISPMLDGIVYDKLGKLAVFVITISLGAFDIALRLLMNKPPRKLTSVTITTDAVTPESRSEKSKPQPPPWHPYPPYLLAALYGVFINECLVASLCAILPFFVRATFSWTALPAGLLFLYIVIPAFADSFAGYLFDRFGARWIACSFVAEKVSALTGLELYASSSSLMNCSLAATGLLGPLAAEGGGGWTTIAMGLFCMMGVIPCVLATGGRRVKVADDGNVEGA
ncbi:MFS general substrate transporter [Macroventuria anomochaeta]|uniref:MFS general substrate transporter n=1 Tax=Macroventuria anomochaeta TaxID=301207 RepID=A0ACB6S618_9PLEO|nr:MFS general substrate transporter [Macroventuria anomochaeta]KAF2629531.1 MFS general substrate transporter [Macroventuria anomochaeta]